MIDQYARQVLPSMVAPLLSLYARYRVHPNFLTVLGFLFAVAASLAVAGSWPYLALGLWWLGRLLDGTDGIWARQSQQTSQFGAYLDILLDMLAYSLMVFGFALLYPGLVYLWMLVLVLYVACITSALVLGAQEGELEAERRLDNRGIRLAVGLAEGGETGLFYTAFLLLPEYIEILLCGWIAVLLITVLARTMLVRRLSIKTDL